MTTATEYIQKALEESKLGNRAATRKLLIKATNADRNSARAWYLLSQVVDDPGEARFCLNEVLRIAPDHEPSLQKLAALPPLPVPAIAAQKPVSKISIVWMFLVFIVGGLSIFFISYLSGASISPGPRNVKMVVRTTPGFYAHYFVVLNRDGVVSTDGGQVFNPFDQTIQLHPGDYIKLQSLGGPVTTFTECEIWVNDKLWRDNRDEMDGELSVAECSGTIGYP